MASNRAQDVKFDADLRDISDKLSYAQENDPGASAQIACGLALMAVLEELRLIRHVLERIERE